MPSHPPPVDAFSSLRTGQLPTAMLGTCALADAGSLFERRRTSCQRFLSPPGFQALFPLWLFRKTTGPHAELPIPPAAAASFPLLKKVRRRGPPPHLTKLLAELPQHEPLFHDRSHASTSFFRQRTKIPLPLSFLSPPFSGEDHGVVFRLICGHSSFPAPGRCFSTCRSAIGRPVPQHRGAGSLSSDFPLLLFRTRIGKTGRPSLFILDSREPLLLRFPSDFFFSGGPQPAGSSFSRSSGGPRNGFFLSLCNSSYHPLFSFLCRRFAS